MNAIDIALRDAWFGMLGRLEGDPEEVERRAGRAARALRRPVSAWCLRIRACDRRLDEWGLACEPELVAAGKAHPVELTQGDLADLCQPVRLDSWPGTDWLDAARALGIGPVTMRQRIKREALEVERYDPRALGKHAGQQVPLLMSRRPLDPTARGGRAPHLMWGNLWERLGKDLPRSYETTLWRVRKPEAVNKVDHGWFFRCPGRYWPVPDGVGASAGGGPVVEINGWRFVRAGCGRLVRVVYLPRPCSTIGDWYGYPEWLPRVRPVWAEIMAQPPACRWCWDVQFAEALSGPNGSKGWNRLVTQVSGGYLQGREVARPLEEVPREDRPKLRSWVCKTELRAGVVRLLLEGKTRPEIAAELQVSLQSVNHHVTQALREHGLRRTRDLRAKLGRRVVFAGTGSDRRAQAG